MFHGYSEGRPGLEIDRYGEVAIITSRAEEAETIEAAAQALLQLYDFACVVSTARGGEVRAIHGALPTEPTVVLEAGLRYSVETWAPRNPGLYLDARPARGWLRDNSEGRRLLNLFSFAGSLGVAAMAGGARSVTHVDTQKRALARCIVNHELNEQRVDARDLIRMDVTRHLQQLARPRANQAVSRQFGGIIIDAPPLPPGAPADAEGLSAIGLARQVAAVTEPGGWILCFFHHDPRSWDDLESAFQEASASRLEPIWRSQSGIDFPQARAEQDLRLTSFRKAGP